MRRIMKKQLLVIGAVALLGTANAVEEEGFYSSLGETYYNELGCYQCHGDAGEGNAVAPRIAGKDSDWIFQQLRLFQVGTRSNPFMIHYSRLAAGKEQEISDWLESLCVSKP